MNEIKESLNPQQKQYESVFQEYKRHFTVKKKLRNNIDNIDEAWDLLLAVVKKVYNLPKEDHLSKKYKFSYLKQEWIVTRFDDKSNRREFAFETVSLDKSYKDRLLENKFTTGFVIKQKMISKKIMIKYTEHVYAHSEMFGFKATLAKFGFKQEIRKNKKLLEATISKLYKTLKSNNKQD